MLTAHTRRFISYVSIATPVCSEKILILVYMHVGLLLHIKLTKYELCIIINTTIIINTLQIHMYG